MLVISRYWNTLRHLKPVQFYGRLWFRVFKPRPALLCVPALRSRSGLWSNPAERRQSMQGPETFCFLNAVKQLEEVGWNGPGAEKLWLYNLHYFDDLNAEGASDRESWHLALLARWVAENSPVAGAGWESYPTSLRIVNWIKWSLAGHVLPDACLDSLAVQARWLYHRIEWHLLGNHVFANAKALVFVGLFFSGHEADAWLSKGLSIIRRELPEQVLPDGGNFERSTMYHAIFLEDVLDLVNLSRLYSRAVNPQLTGTWIETALRMLQWSEGMSHPDGQIALFNDAAFDIAPAPDQLLSYACRLGLPGGDARIASEAHGLTLLTWRASGYVRMGSLASVVLLDVAPVGPDYLPGHAHADTLSFEMSVFGQRVVVNGGTSCYGLSPRRQLERKTMSHSTVEIGGQDSSEVWSGFRVARRAYPFGLECSDDGKVLRVACSHDGYRRLPGSPVHTRQWTMRRGQLLVTDAVTGGARPALARFIFHPAVEASLDAPSRRCTVTLPGGRYIVVTILAGWPRLEESSYAPRFGEVLPAQCLVVDLEHGQAQTRWDWHEV